MEIENDEAVRVLLLAPEKAIGGIATWTKFLLKYSDRRRIRYHLVDTSKLYEPLGKKLSFRGAIFGLKNAALRFYSVLRSLSMVRPNTVYLTTSPNIGLFVRDVPLMLLFKMIGVPCIVHLRGGKLEGFIGKSKLRNWLTIQAFRSCRAVFVITRGIEKSFRKIVSKDKTFYIPNMIDDRILDTSNEKKIYSVDQKHALKIILVAWQAREKGSMDLVEAMRYVELPILCQLVGVAAPENKKTLIDMIIKYHLENKVELVGLKLGRELEKVYEQADFMVFPSHSEGFPNVVIEAMAQGVPIIATDVGNIREMVGYDSTSPAGIIIDTVNPVDTKELAEKIDSLALNVLYREQLSRNGRNRIKNKYVVSKVLPGLEALVCKLSKSNCHPKTINHIFKQKFD